MLPDKRATPRFQVGQLETICIVDGVNISVAGVGNQINLPVRSAAKRVDMSGIRRDKYVSI